MTESRSRKNGRARSFSTLLRVLSDENPKTAALLTDAQSMRQENLSGYLGGARLNGFEELIDHLEQLENVFQQSRRLRGISVLIGRVRDDFQLGLDTTLSGFYSVAHDAMRDVMEVQFLLREFENQPSLIDQWLHASPTELYKTFRPAVLRQRHANRQKKQAQDMAEATDYRMHSMMLHVSPQPLPFERHGFSGHKDPFSTDICFWEMFEHGRRVLFAAHGLRRKLARHIKSPWGPRRGLKRFRDAWVRTREMQALWLILLERAREEIDDDEIELDQ